MSNRLWIIGAVLVCIAIVVLGWFLGVSPKLGEASIASLARQNVDAQNQAQAEAIALLKRQFADIEEIEDELEELQASIPEQSSLDSFIDSVVAAANANGVIIENVTALEGATYGGSVDPTAATDPEAVQPAEPVAADPNSPSTTLDASLVGRFFTIGVSIKVLGSADQVYALADSLQMAERLFLVTDVDFNTDGEPNGTITGFVYVVTAPPAVAQ